MANEVVAVPGQFFPKSVREATDDTLWIQLIASGTVWFDYEHDEEAAYPNCKPRHCALMDRAEKSYESARRKANCRACYARHGERVRGYCGDCFWNPNHNRAGELRPCPNCKNEMVVRHVWRVQKDGSFIIMSAECDSCGALYEITGQDRSEEGE